MSDSENEEQIIYDSDEPEDGNDEISSEEEDDLKDVETFGTFFPHDSSSEEEWDDPTQNRVGEIPMEYYDDYDHIGYNIRGKKVARPEKKDELDKLLDKEENKDYWRTVFDTVNQKEVVLSKEDYELVKSIVKGKYPGGFNPEQDFPDFDYEDSIHPLSGALRQKASFIPSKWEAKEVNRLVRAIKKGYIKLNEEPKKEEKFYLMWNEDDKLIDAAGPKQRDTLPAPKMRPPGHSESYNPPAEYLLSDKELKRYQLLDAEDRPMNFIPKKYPTLRKVPFYNNIVKERFERCLNLFLSVRTLPKARPNIDPNSLLPELPSPDKLRPFPTMQSLLFKGHEGKVRSISANPTGEYLASASDDGTVRVWEISTGRCFKVWKFEQVVYSVSWNPNPSVNVIAAAIGKNMVLLNAMTLFGELNDATELAFEKGKKSEDAKTSELKWEYPTEEEFKTGIRARIPHHNAIKQITWHAKGDYIAAVSPDANGKAMLFMHHLSKAKSQSPFSNFKSQIQQVQFHPTKPYFFIATQRTVRVYNLAAVRLEKTLYSTSQWISSLAIHPGGDNLLIGTYDKKLSWFDLDLSTKPYKTLRYHRMALRSVAFHQRYPLFASVSDDLTIHVFHATVYNDLLTNAMIVPLKILRGHEAHDDVGILGCVFHPHQPWLLSCGADATIRLWT